MAAHQEDGSLRPTAGSGGPLRPGGTPAGPSGAISTEGDGESRFKSSQSLQNCGKPPASPATARARDFRARGRVLSTPARTASKVVCVDVADLANLILVDPDPAPFSFPILIRGRDLVAGSGRIRAALVAGSPAELPALDLLLLPDREAEALVSAAADLSHFPDHQPADLNALAKGVLDRALSLLEGGR